MSLKNGLSEYKKAVRMGQKEGGAPEILDVILKEKGLTGSRSVSLGNVQIPIERIVGTRSDGRSHAFSKGFYPLMDTETEFANKWICLYCSHMEEGIRESIKAYEFMNRFYVEEGNKRVSVLKYVGAVSVPGNVMRIIPPHTCEKDVQIYYEFMDFYNLSQINYIWFSNEGSFAKLQYLVGKRPDEMWTAEDKLDFSSVYNRFAAEYEQSAQKKKLSIDVGDAFLRFIDLYEYHSLKSLGPAQMKEKIHKVWEEFYLLLTDQSLELQMEPVSEETIDNKKSLISKVLPTEAAAHLTKETVQLTKETSKQLGKLIPKEAKEQVKKLIPTEAKEQVKKLIPEEAKTQVKKLLTSDVQRVAFIHEKTAETSGWTYAHELGRLHLEEVFGPQVQTACYDNAAEETFDEMIHQAIRDGSTVIFTTTPPMLKASVKAALEYPEVKILNCSLNTSYRCIRTYYARMYEPKFLLGAIAGAMSENDNIGYVADYPIYGAIANINAFALGAKMVNPRAKIYLEWSCMRDDLKDDVFMREHVRYVSGRDMSTPGAYNRRFGLYPSTEDHPWNLAMPVWHWGIFYEHMLRNILNGDWKYDDASSETKGLNYWWGMSSGIVDVICSHHMPIGTSRLIDLLKHTICTGEFSPFAGVLYSQDGIVEKDADKPLTPEEIITMNWLAENVVGVIPTVEELIPQAVPVVATQGVLNSSKK